MSLSLQHVNRACCDRIIYSAAAWMFGMYIAQYSVTATSTVTATGSTTTMNRNSQTAHQMQSAFCPSPEVFAIFYTPQTPPPTPTPTLPNAPPIDKPDIAVNQ